MDGGAGIVLLRTENAGPSPPHRRRPHLGDTSWTPRGHLGRDARVTATFDGREAQNVAVAVSPGSGAPTSHFTPARPGVPRVQPARPARTAGPGRALQAAGAAQWRHRRLPGDGQRRRPGRRRAPRRVADPGREALGVQPAGPSGLNGVPGRDRVAGGAARHRRADTPAVGVCDGHAGGAGLDGVRAGREGVGRGVRAAVPRLADHRVGARGGSSAYGSTAGLRELAERGAAESGTPALVALSDGPAPERRETGDTDAGGGGGGAGRGSLRAHEEVPVRDLALADLRRVYAGEVTD